MKRLWVHEVLRVYGDRLVDDMDIRWLVEEIKKTVRDYMEDDMEQLFNDLLEGSETEVKYLVFKLFSRS